MSELLSSPNAGSVIWSTPVSFLSLPGPNQSVPCRQSCTVSLRNAASRSVVRNRLTPPLALKLPKAALHCRLHSHYGMSGSCSPRGGGR
jgi:hypothetical protein